MIMEFGIMGGLLILGAWLFETFESVKNHKKLVDLRFAAVYAFGNACLLAYSWLTGDMIFLSVNIGILAIVLFEIIYTLFKFGRRR